MAMKIRCFTAAARYVSMSARLVASGNKVKDRWGSHRSFEGSINN